MQSISQWNTKNSTGTVFAINSVRKYSKVSQVTKDLYYNENYMSVRRKKSNMIRGINRKLDSFNKIIKSTSYLI